MENNKITAYQTSLERYVANASEAQTRKTYRRSMTHILKVGLMAINATTAIICQYDPERIESTVIAEAHTSRASESEVQSDVGEVYDEREYPNAYEWLTDENHEPLRLERDKLERDSAEYREFIEYGFFTAVYIPIVVNSKLWGYVEVWESRYPRPFTEEEIELLQQVVSYIAKAVAVNNPDELF